jgi:hypothetical protein
MSLDEDIRYLVDEKESEGGNKKKVLGCADQNIRIILKYKALKCKRLPPNIVLHYITCVRWG